MFARLLPCLYGLPYLDRRDVFITACDTNEEVLVLVRRVFHCAMTFELYDFLLAGFLKPRITFISENARDVSNK